MISPNYGLSENISTTKRSRVQRLFPSFITPLYRQTFQTPYVHSSSLLFARFPVDLLSTFSSSRFLIFCLSGQHGVNFSWKCPIRILHALPRTKLIYHKHFSWWFCLNPPLKILCQSRIHFHFGPVRHHFQHLNAHCILLKLKQRSQFAIVMCFFLLFQH